MISDSLHNITDGFLIAPAFLIDPRLGILTSLGIIVHELAQEISEFFVYKSAGYTDRQALTRNFVSASSILIGSLGGFFILSISANLVSGLLAVALGIILYTIVRDLIPHAIRNAYSERTYIAHIAIMVLGVLLVFGINQVNGDTHSHAEDDTHDHIEDIHQADDHKEVNHEEASAQHAETHTDDDTHLDEHGH